MSTIVPHIPFPYVPYAGQKDLMDSIYKTLTNKGIGIFESPTGTGKTMSVICSTLTWLQHYREAGSDDESDAVDEPKESNSSVSKKSWFEEPDWCLTNDSYSKKTEKENLLKRRMETRLILEGRLELIRKSGYVPGVNIPGYLVHRREFAKDKESASVDADEDITDTSSFPSVENISSEAEINEKIDRADPDESYMPKIIYVARTHSQVSQFIAEVRKSPFHNRCTLVPLGGRRNLCVNDSVQSLQSDSAMSERCRELQSSSDAVATEPANLSASVTKKSDIKTGTCPFLTQQHHRTLLEEASLALALDVEQLAQAGRDHSACSYFAARKAAKSADIVCLPYNLLLNQSARAAVGLSALLPGAAVVVDEAHNLLDAIFNVNGSKLRPLDTLITFKAVSKYYLKYFHRLSEGNRRGCEFLLRWIAGLAILMDVDIRMIQFAAKPEGINLSSKKNSSVPLNGSLTEEPVALVHDDGDGQPVFRTELMDENISETTKNTLPFEPNSNGTVFIRAVPPTPSPSSENALPSSDGSISTEQKAPSKLLKWQRLLSNPSPSIPSPLPSSSKISSSSPASGSESVKKPQVLKPAPLAPPSKYPLVLKVDLIEEKLWVEAPLGLFESISSSLLQNKSTNVSNFQKNSKLSLKFGFQKSLALKENQGSREVGAAINGVEQAKRKEMNETTSILPSMLLDTMGCSDIPIFRLRMFVETAGLHRKLRGFLEQQSRSLKKQQLASKQKKRSRESDEEVAVVEKAEISSNSLSEATSSDTRDFGSSDEYDSPIASLQNVLSFLKCTATSDEEGRILYFPDTSTPSRFPSGIRSDSPMPSVTPSSVNNESIVKGYLKFILLDPVSPFTEILQKARSVILVGGTLHPSVELRSLLFRGVPEQNENACVVSKSLNSVQSNSSSLTLEKGIHATLMDSLELTRGCKTLRMKNFPPVVPSGALLSATISTVTLARNDVESPSSSTNIRSSTPHVLDFRSSSRFSASVLAGLERILLDTADLCPTGMVVFFPSFDFLYGLMRLWGGSLSSNVSLNSKSQSNSKYSLGKNENTSVGISDIKMGSVLDKLQQRKALFVEPRSSKDLDSFLSLYSAAATTKSSELNNSLNLTSFPSTSSRSGAILFSVLGGKLSEGINFSDDLARVVVVVGVPFGPPTDPELLERIKYIERSQGVNDGGNGVSGMVGREYYENVTMRVVNQAVGRSIRHRDDYAFVIFADCRYADERIRSKIPGWVRRDICPSTEWTSVRKNMAQFFQNH